MENFRVDDFIWMNPVLLAILGIDNKFRAKLCARMKK